MLIESLYLPNSIKEVCQSTNKTISIINLLAIYEFIYNMEHLMRIKLCKLWVTLDSKN